MTPNATRDSELRMPDLSALPEAAFSVALRAAWPPRVAPGRP
jgi:hypothetical protein